VSNTYTEEELLEWVDKTIEGWKRAASSSHTKALMNPSLIEAYKKDTEHLRQIKELIETASKDEDSASKQRDAYGGYREDE